MGEKAVPLWRMRVLHAQIRSSEEAEKIFEAALKHVHIAKDIKPIWLEWLVLTKGKTNINAFYILFFILFLILKLSVYLC